MPSLNLLITEFPSRSADTPIKFSRSFANFATLALVRRPNTIPLHKFHLFFQYTDNHRHRSLVTSWIRYALNCNAIDLELEFGVTFSDRNDENNEDNGDDDKNSNDNGDQLYEFHFCDLKNSSVRDFALLGCRMVLPSSISTRFEFLMSVLLDYVDVSDEMLSNMILGCENLEKLVLRQFQGLRKFKIFSEKLKELELSFYYPKKFEDLESSVEICAPNLHSIRISYFYVNKFDMKDLSSLVEAELDFYRRDDEYCPNCWIAVMSLLSGVKRLNNQYWLKFVDTEMSPSVEFNNLNLLELKTGYIWDHMFGLFLLLERCARLETLVLDYLYPKDEDVTFRDEYNARPFSFNFPSLRELQMKNHRFTTS